MEQDRKNARSFYGLELGDRTDGHSHWLVAESAVLETQKWKNLWKNAAFYGYKILKNAELIYKLYILYMIVDTSIYAILVTNVSRFIVRRSRDSPLWAEPWTLDVEIFLTGGLPGAVREDAWQLREFP